MSNYIYGMEEHRHQEERKNAPQQCPFCKQPINQNLRQWDKVKYHCGATACRSAAYRQRKADRRSAARDDADARINQYAASLPAEQGAAVRAMRDVLMGYKQPDCDQGHEQALAIIRTIEAQRCKHDRIQVLLDNASAAKRRAEKAEEHNRELKALYERRIEELEAEIHVYQLLEGAVYGIATKQLQKQPDQEERPAPEPQADEIDPDRERVLAVLAQAGIPPYTGQEELDE